jgi:hypothetical protein
VKGAPGQKTQGDDEDRQKPEKPSHANRSTIKPLSLQLRYCYAV